MKKMDSLNSNEVSIDRVVVLMKGLKFGCRSINDFDAFLEKINNEIFKVEYRKVNYAKLKTLKGSNIKVTRGNINFDPKKEELSFYVIFKLNPLKINYNRYQDGFIKDFKGTEDEDILKIFKKSLDNNTNFIVEELADDMEYEYINDICLLAFEDEIENIISKIKKCAKTSLSGGDRIIEQPSLYLQDIELALDVFVSDSIFFVKNLSEKFRSRFKRLKNDEYDKRFTKESDHNAFVLSGNVSKNIKFKIYTKTDKCVRFETVYNKNAIRTLHNKNHIEFPYRQGLSLIIEDLFPKFHEELIHFNTNLPKIVEHKEAFIFIHKLARSLKEDEFLTVLEIMDLCGGLASIKPYRKQEKLSKRGLLERVSRAWYSLSPENREYLHKFLQFPSIPDDKEHNRDQIN